MHGGKQTAAMGSKGLAGIGGSQAAGAAVQQLHAMQIFQPADVLAHGRRGHAQGLRGGVHTAVFEHGGESEQGLRSSITVYLNKFFVFTA